MRDVPSFRRGVLGSLALATLAALAAPDAAVSAATITLRDGSVVHGEIRSVQDDAYTIETDTLGTVRVRKQDIRTIDYDHEPAAESSPGAADLQALQLRLMQSPNLLSAIQALQEDPDVQAVLSDPEIMSAIASGDYAALLDNPKIVALTRNPKMREIIDAAQ